MQKTDDELSWKEIRSILTGISVAIALVFLLLCAMHVGMK